MASNAVHPNTGTGILVTFDGSPLGEVTDMPSVAGASTDQIEVTHFQSLAKEFLSGLKDNGEIQLTVNLDPSDEGQRKAYAANGSGANKAMTITFPYTPTMTLSLSVAVTQFAISASTGAAVSADFTGRVSGEITGFPAVGS